MSALAEDTYQALIKKLGRRKKQPWQNEVVSWVSGLSDPLWEKIHPVILRALDDMKDHGASRPLAQLQEIAFAEALKTDAPHAHTAALWLTDTRLRVEAFREDPSDKYRVLRRHLVARGILKGSGG